MPNNIFRIAVSSLMVVFTLLSQSAYSQGEIQREVRVVKPYSPTLSDAEKINLLPDMYDTVRIMPAFNYSITPKRFSTDYKVEQIKPARMVGLPLEKLYKSQLTLGMGNYLTPLGELSINQLRSRNSAIGLYLKHHSSGGKVKLDNNERVFSGFSDNTMNLFGKYFFAGSVIEGGINADYDHIHYYGYNTNTNDTILEKDDIKQWIFSGGANVKYYSSHNDSSRLSYKIGFDYRYTLDAFDHSEHAYKTSGNMGKLFGDQYVGLGLGLNHYQTPASIDSTNNTLLTISPSVSKRSGEWMFLVGVNTTLDINGNDLELKLYPRAAFEFHIVKDVLTPYLAIDGYRGENNYRRVLYENPFIVPGLKVKNSNYGFVAHAGLKGRYSSKMAFNIQGSYAMVEDMYFFVNDTSNVLENQFKADYDNVRVSGLAADVSWNKTEKLKFLFKGRYYNYEMTNLDYAWHKPEFELSFGASYNLRDKILIDADLFYNGKRYAPSADPSIPVILEGYPDANLNIEYRYTKLLSFFLRFNNFTASRYHIWNQYPSQRFQIMGGFTYAL